MSIINNYVVGKGKLFFNQFAKGTRVGPGLRYFGNTPTLDTTRTATALDHFSSEGGIKVKDDSIDIETNINGKFTCDNISGANIALWFGGVNSAIVQAASAAALTEVINVSPDAYYQVGTTPGNPAGVRGIGQYTLTMGATPLVEGIDYTVAPASGLVHILPGSAVVVAPADVNVSYHTLAGAQSLVVEHGSTIYGALKFIADNPKGVDRDYFYPYVKLTAGGTFALKGDTWQQCEFNYEALKLDDATERCYIAAR